MISSRRVGWIILISVLGNVLTLVLAVGMVLQLRGQLCSVVAGQDQVYEETPPSTAAGQNAARAWDNLRGTFKCP